MVYLTTSLLTGALSSVQPSGLSSHSSWVLYTISPPPTTLRPTAWWRGVTASSRMPCGPAPPVQTGLLTSHGCYWASGPPPRRILASLLLSFSTVPLWSSLVSFLVSLSRRRRFFTSPPELHLHTSPPGVPSPPRSLRRSLISSRVLLLFTSAAAVPNRRSHPLTAGPSPWFPALRSSSFWTWESATNQSAWTDSSPRLAHPSSRRPPLLAVAVLLFRWLQRRHLGGGSVETPINPRILV